MKLIEHLEFVIGLMDNEAPKSEIKQALLAMHQEIESYDERETKSAQNLSALQAEHQKLKDEHAKFKAPSNITTFPNSASKKIARH